MIVQIFALPEEERLWRTCKLGDINDAISFEYTKYFCGPGTFTLVVPSTTIFASVLAVNVLLIIDGEGFIIKNLLHDTETIKLTGYDLNGILLDRITLYTDAAVAGSEGNDVVSGTTEYCIKHYITNNMLNSLVPERNYPRFACAENLDRGTAEDSYLARLEKLEDVVRTLCEASQLGYRISITTEDVLNTSPVLTFDVVEQVDKTVNQSVRNRVVFSIQRKNITKFTREIGVTADKNTFYCENSSDTVLPVYKDSNNIAAGYGRREEYMSITGGTDELEIYAKQAIADKYTETDSVTIEAGNPQEYGVLYDVGDKVTVYDKERTLQLDSVISAVTIKKSATENSVSITLGESKPKLLDGYAKKSDTLAKTTRENPPVKEGCYTRAIEFRSGGFDLEFIDKGGNAITNAFTVTENAQGQITAITNTTAGRTIEVTYDD